MKKELLSHLIPLALIFFVTSFFWILNSVSFSQYIFLFLGLSIGAFFLDLDHFIYWYYVEPNSEESRNVQSIIKSKKYKKAFIFFARKHKKHTSLFLHHFFFQVILGLISFLVFTSSHNTFFLAFILALNIHLLIDEIEDYIYKPKHLQTWLFAREESQLALEKIRYYLILFIFFSLFFTFLLIRSNL